LINRWLKLARIEELNIKDNFQEFSLEPIIDESVELIKPLALEKGIKIEKKSIDSDYKIFGERDLIKEVFINLITNGVKYNQNQGSVSINFRKNGDYIAVDITDTGIGISEDELNRLGEEFYRVKREGIASGSGLGLAIVKKILDIHNGRLEIQSKINQGSTFTVYLPFSINMERDEKRSE
jgi:two-component system phosphate regulon sensor histidine kinase PhoR